MQIIYINKQIQFGGFTYRLYSSDEEEESMACVCNDDLFFENLEFFLLSFIFIFIQIVGLYSLVWVFLVVSRLSPLKQLGFFMCLYVLSIKVCLVQELEQLQESSVCSLKKMIISEFDLFIVENHGTHVDIRVAHDIITIFFNIQEDIYLYQSILL